MRVKTFLKTLSLISVLTGCTVANALPGFVGSNDYTQVISINNVLANKPNNVTGTRTPIHVNYYMSNGKSCWWNELQFGEGITIHAGPNQGCLTKVTRVEIYPLPTAGKLHPYEGTINVSVDPSKFSSMITVKQNSAPVFNAETGMIDKPGTLTFSMDSTLR